MVGRLRKLVGLSVATDTSPGGAYSKMRRRLLSIQRVEVGIPAAPSYAPIWGAVMETGYPGATTTLFTFADDTTSFYFSNGRGLFGGHLYETVCNANKAFLTTANQLLEHFRPATKFRIPKTYHVVFHALTDSGGLTSHVTSQDQLASGDHPLSELYAAGQEVLTQLRLVNDDQLDT